jgi:hypothetical protein
MKEVAELTRQLDLAQSQVENLLQSSEGDRASTVWLCILFFTLSILSGTIEIKKKISRSSFQLYQCAFTIQI